MDRIKDENGEWKETPAEIQGVIESYFSRLFTTSNLDGRLSYREVVKQVSEIENEELVVEVTIEEVKNDVFSMHPDKAPVSDGLNPVFFQVFWCIVEADVVKFYHNFMNTGVLPDGVNKSLVCLIPKTKAPQTMGDLRPMSLCNVLVRILSMVWQID